MHFFPAASPKAPDAAPAPLAEPTPPHRPRHKRQPSPRKHKLRHRWQAQQSLFRRCLVPHRGSHVSPSLFRRNPNPQQKSTHKERRQRALNLTERRQRVRFSHAESGWMRMRDALRVPSLRAQRPYTGSPPESQSTRTAHHGASGRVLLAG